MDAREAALAFVRAFCAGDVAALEALLAEELRFEGPFVRCGSRAEYLALLRADPPEPAGWELLHAFGEGTRAAVFFRYDKPALSVPMALYCELAAGGSIGVLRLYFDGRAFA